MIRKLKGLTQTDVLQLSSLPPKSPLDRWEKGYHCPDTEKVKKLATGLDVSVNFFYFPYVEVTMNKHLKVFICIPGDCDGERMFEFKY